MKRIALDGEFGFTDEQKARLEAVGQVDQLDTVSSEGEWLEKVEGYDVVCTWGDFVLGNLRRTQRITAK